MLIEAIKRLEAAGFTATGYTRRLKLSGLSSSTEPIATMQQSQQTQRLVTI